MRIIRPRLLIASLSAALLISGCSGGSSDPLGTGRVSLAVSDGPVHDAVKVCVEFDSVEFKSNSDTIVVDLDPSMTINLLDYQGAESAPLLIGQDLPAGDYQWIRLGVNAARGAGGGANDSSESGCDGDGSYIKLPTGTHNLYVPSGENNGLKLNRGFTVPVNGTSNFTAEFDLMKSVTAPNGQAPDVMLRPTIRLVDNIEVGTLTGTVLNDLASASDCAPSIFVFNDDVEPNPINIVGDDTDAPDDPTEAVATAMPSMGDNAYEYTVGYLLAGDYEVAFTCDGETFLPVMGKPVSIAAGAIAEVHFP